MKSIKFNKEKILKPGTTNNSNNVRRAYNFVNLWREKKSYSKTIHKLVAESFIGVFDPILTVDHIDNNPFNNNVTNLQIELIVVKILKINHQFILEYIGQLIEINGKHK